MNLKEAMQTMQNYLAQINAVAITVRLFLAVLIGGTIGLDRGRKKRPAGIKTHVLVCMGAALVMMTGQYVSEQYAQVGDVARLGAQVISGIGFLGAGTIMVTRKSQIKGLTTAAGLWYSACMGLAVGIGFYEGAIIAWGFMLVIITWFNKLEDSLYGRSKMVELYIEVDDGIYVSELITFIKNNPCKLLNVEVEKLDGNVFPGVAVFLTIMLDNKEIHEALLEALQRHIGVRFLEEV